MPTAPEKQAATESPAKAPAPAAVPASSQFERRLAELRKHVPVLKDAISAADPIRAIDASVEVSEHLDTAQELAVASKRPEDKQALTEIQQVADAALRDAPRPSIEAGTQALRGSWDLWDQEIGGWRAMHGAPSDVGTPAEIAASGTRGEGQPLPFQKEIQASFGHHDVSDVKAHVGGDAARAASQLGASAFATGKHVGFASSPGLHTAAHEAAHTAQQQKDVQLEGGMDGGPHDPLEQHADAVADLVVAGRSAAPLLDQVAQRGGAATVSMSAGVQRKSDGDKAPRPKPNALGAWLRIQVVPVGNAVRERLAATSWPDPASDVPFEVTTGSTGVPKFRSTFLQNFLPHLDSGETLPQLLHPSDIFDQFVENFHKRFPKLDEVNEKEWLAEDPVFGREVARAVERAAVESLMRLGPRYRTALIRRGHKPEADDLTVSHPMDPLVARALVEPGVVDDTQVANSDPKSAPKADPKSHAKDAKSHAKVEVPADKAPALADANRPWLGRKYPELWNFVRGSASATVEDVAVALWGTATMAYAISKYGDLFRIAPAHARKLIAERYRDEVAGSGDPDAATQIMALARTDLAYGDAAPQQFNQKADTGTATQTAPTHEQLAGLEKSIGGVLDSIHAQVAPVGMSTELGLAYGARAARILVLANADAKTRTDWLPVLQFQHVQLMSISSSIAPILKKLLSLKAPAPDTNKQHERDQLQATLTLYMQAVAVSHLRDESTALVRSIAAHEHRAQQRGMDAAQEDLEQGTGQAAGLPGKSDPRAVEAAERIGNERQAVMKGRTEGHSPYDRQMAVTLAGEVALSSRMRAAEHALTQLYAAAVDAFGSPEAMHKVLPNVKTYPEVIADVKAHLANVQSTWDEAAAKGVPTVQTDTHAPADWGKWQGREAGVAAARIAYANIAGDKSLGEFFKQAQEKIKHQQLVTAIVRLGVTLLITIATGMGAAALGKAAAGALVGEAANLAEQAAALTVELAINVPINSAVQLAMSDGQGSVGWAMLQNALMELLTRGIMSRLRNVQQAALAEARAFATLPRLEAAEQRALATLDFAGTEVMAELVGGMASNWTADQLVQILRKNGEAVSEPFAYTVLQQGAAIGLGRYFHGQLRAWTQHRTALENTKIGRNPEALALYSERDEFFRQANELANSLSPDPAAQDRLADLNTALLKKERALFGHSDASHPLANEHAVANEHSPQAVAHEGAAPGATSHPTHADPATTAHPANTTREPSPAANEMRRVDDEVQHLGLQLANVVGDARYVGESVFRVGTSRGAVLVEVVRTSGAVRLRESGDHRLLEIPKGVSGSELERIVVGKLTELREMELRSARGETAAATSALGEHGTGARLSPADMGKVAELRLLEIREAEQTAKGPSGVSEAARIRGEIDALEAALGLHATTPEAAARRRAVDVQVEVQNDAARRQRVRGELDGAQGHPGIDLHNHFLGIAEAEVFRQRAASAGGSKDSGSWGPLLNRIAALEGENFEHKYDPQDKTKITHPGRAVAGDAVRIADEALKQYNVVVERANAKGLPTEERASLLRSAELVAEEGCKTALAATPETDYNSAYEIRDQLVKDTFGGPRAPEEKGPAVADRAYDDYIREAILQLARDGVGYSEQSVSLKKLAGTLSAERIQAAIAQLVAEGKLRPGQVDVRILGMMPTRHFGERDAKLPPVNAAERTEAGFQRDVDSTAKATRHPGTVGNDVAGMEQFTFDDVGIARFKTIYKTLLGEAVQTGSPKVFRPHVGEGVVEPQEGKPFHTDKDRHITDGEPSHYPRSRTNIDALLDVMEQVKTEGLLDSSKVIVRFGHLTHATPAQAARLRGLGVVAEVNLGSNATSGAVSQTEGVHGPRSSAERFDDHSFATLLYYDAPIAISTDAGAVMSTSLRAEYQRANQIIEEVLSGARPVRIRVEDATVDGVERGRTIDGKPAERELTINELTPTERARYLHAYEKLYADAERYYKRRPKPGSAGAGPSTDVSPFGGVHHVGPAVSHGLVARNEGTAIFEGVGADVRAAALTYRGESYFVGEEMKAGNVVMYDVRSPDGEFRTLLRSWAGEGPAYLPFDPREGPKTNGEVRAWYKSQLGRIAELNKSWIGEGTPLEERAHRAYEIRRHARMAAREQMQSSGDVASLAVRDLVEYGDVDGATFEELVASKLAEMDETTKQPRTREQALEAIIGSARRSNARYDQRHGATEKKP